MTQQNYDSWERDHCFDNAALNLLRRRGKNASISRSRQAEGANTCYLTTNASQQSLFKSVRFLKIKTNYIFLSKSPMLPVCRNAFGTLLNIRLDIAVIFVSDLLSLLPTIMRLPPQRRPVGVVTSCAASCRHHFAKRSSPFCFFDAQREDSSQSSIITVSDLCYDHQENLH